VASDPDAHTSEVTLEFCALLTHPAAELLPAWSRELSLAGYNVRIATTADEAIRQSAEAARLDLLLVGGEFPDCTPGELIALVADRWPGVEVVLLHPPSDTRRNSPLASDIRLAPDPAADSGAARDAALSMIQWVLRDSRKSGERTWTAEGEPIVNQCAYCWRVKNLRGDWHPVEPGYLVPANRVSHGICRDCMDVQLERLRRGTSRPEEGRGVDDSDAARAP
jgi:hypothetical protein